MDVENNRLIAIVSPHPGEFVGHPDNGYLVLLTMIDMEASVCVIMEMPFSATNDWPKCIGHGFDNIELVGGVLYKFTNPIWRSGQGYVQPQICMVDKNKLTLDPASGSLGAAFLGSIPPHDAVETPGEPNITANALFYLPVPKYLISFHKKTIYPTNIGVVPPVLLPPKAVAVVPPAGTTGPPFHNLGHFQPILGKGIFGGGAYNPGGAEVRYSRQFFTVSNDTALTITELDEAPYVLSVSETNLESGAEVKACFTWSPINTESLAFTDRLEILAVDPNRPVGLHWRVVGPIPIRGGPG